MKVYILLPALVSMSLFAEEGWRDLLPKQGLGDWINVNCVPETWQMGTDGMLRCTGFPTGALRTPRMYENFILEVEWRHMKPAGNAGIFLWASPIAATGAPFLRSIEVQVLDHGYGNTASYTTHGDVFPIWGSTMIPFGRSHGMRSFPSEQRSKPSPEWNHYRIHAQNGVVRLSVNGKEVSGGEKCNWRKGYLGLESEGSPTEWRLLRIQELPPGDAPIAETAEEAQGHRPLYTGLDLRGWKTTAPERWKPEDWRLQMQAGEQSAELWMDEKIASVECIVDVKPKAGAAILLRKGDGAALHLPLTGAEPDKWSRTILQVHEREAVLQVGNAPQVKFPLTEGADQFGISADAVGAEFANIYLRPLPSR